MSSGYSGSIQIELNPVINPIDNRVMNGFTIATYDDLAMSYKIDVLADYTLMPLT